MVTQVDPLRSSLLGKPPSPLVLRVEGTERDGQVVQLNRAKCVIGSAASCTLRLAAAGVRPQHCVIWRGLAGMVLQSVDAEVLINGQSVSESSLVSGDLITIGAVSFRVDPESVQLPTPQTARQVQSLEKRLGEIRGRNRRRMHRLIDLVRQAKPTETPAAPIAPPQPLDLPQDSAIAAQLAEAELQLQKLQQTRAINEEKISLLEQQLAQAEDAHRELQASGSFVSPAAFEAQDKAQRDAADANERLQVLSRGWSQREEELTRRIEELESFSQQRNAPQSHFTAEEVEDQVEAEAEVEEEVADETVESAPRAAEPQVSVAEVLAKFGFNPDADDEAEEEEYEAPSPPPQIASYEEPASPSDDDDVSIEEYMSSLMNRVRGREGSATNPAPSKAPVKPPEPPKPVKEQTLFNPGEFIPSRKAPEQTSDLRALRDLANQSARSAIDVHTLKSWSNMYVTKVIVSFVAFTTAICLLLETKSFASLQFLGAAIGIIISIFWGFQAAIVYGQVRTARKIENLPEATILETSLPHGFDLPTEEVELEPNQAPLRDTPPAADQEHES